MRHAIALDDLDRRSGKNFQVKSKGLVRQIVVVQLDLCRDRLGHIMTDEERARVERGLDELEED